MSAGPVTCDLARLRAPERERDESTHETLRPAARPLWEAAQRGDYDATIHEVEDWES